MAIREGNAAPAVALDDDMEERVTLADFASKDAAPYRVMQKHGARPRSRRWHGAGMASAHVGPAGAPVIGGFAAALRRALAALVVIGVLADASACAVSWLEPPPSLGQVALSEACHCGCKAHTGAVVGIGLTQLAALPAELEVPDGPRAVPERAALPAPPRAPLSEIDHVPIALA